MDSRTRYEDLDEAISAIVEAKLSQITTSVPCEVVSVDLAKQTVVLQPTVKARVNKPDGTSEWMALPQIPDVPIHFPSGGGVSMTFPIKKGDEALAVISSRSQDAWQQNGGVQPQVDLRSHDLSNAFAFVGFKSNGKALENVSSASTQIRSDDGKQVVDMHPSSGLTLTSEGTSIAIGKDGVDITAGYLKCNGKRIDDSHTHNGVEPGAGTSGTPV